MTDPLRGVAPLDPTTDIGKTRTLIGDTVYVELTPPEAGYGAYTNFGDDQIQSFIDLGLNNLAYAVGYAYMSLAAQFAADGIKFTTDDESVDLSLRADAMRKLAAEWFSRGDAINAAGVNDFFEIVYPVWERDLRVPELAAPWYPWSPWYGPIE